MITKVSIYTNTFSAQLSLRGQLGSVSKGCFVCRYPSINTVRMQVTTFQFEGIQLVKRSRLSGENPRLVCQKAQKWCNRNPAASWRNAVTLCATRKAKPLSPWVAHSCSDQAAPPTLLATLSHHSACCLATNGLVPLHSLIHKITTGLEGGDPGSLPCSLTEASQRSAHWYQTPRLSELGIGVSTSNCH